MDYVVMIDSTHESQERCRMLNRLLTILHVLGDIPFSTDYNI